MSNNNGLQPQADAYLSMYVQCTLNYTLLYRTGEEIAMEQKTRRWLIVVGKNYQE
jgi:hypothetical protein